VPGQRPSQEAKCLALLKRDKSGPTSAMTFRAVVVGEEAAHQYLIDNRDKIFAKHLDDSIRALGIEVLRSPVASPKTNSICERVIGTLRRECLDWGDSAIGGTSAIAFEIVGRTVQPRQTA